MTRQMIVRGPKVRHSLSEAPGRNEEELQSVMRDNPGLLPLEDLGVEDEIAALGREVRVSTGAIDLLLISTVGEVILVEFKTGPQNTDFRHVLAQLLDYGSALHGLSLEAFEQRLLGVMYAPAKSNAVSDGNQDGAHPQRPLASLGDAFTGQTLDPTTPWRDTLTKQLEEGTFHYVVVAQRFTDQMLRTLAYLNEVTNGCQFSAVELIKFTGHPEWAAFEGRVHATSARSRAATTKSASLSGGEEFLERLTDDTIRMVTADLLRHVSSIPGMKIFWGVQGCSFRASVPGRSPLTIGWLFPPDQPGFMGLKSLTLGWYQDSNGLAVSGDASQALSHYAETARRLPGASAPKAGPLTGATVPLASLGMQLHDVESAITQIAESLAQSSPTDVETVGDGPGAGDPGATPAAGPEDASDGPRRR